MDPSHLFVSRGGLKLRHALDTFQLAVTGLGCADFGASTGGFTDCLLQAGAAHVTAIDTAYGEFAWKLRNDPRVTLLERTNALHAPPPADPEKPDLIVIDLGWTPQRLAIPAALRWLRADPDARIITLIKPHYELAAYDPAALPRGAILDDARAEQVVQQILASLPALGVTVLGCTKSPITGSKGSPRGNPEWLALLARTCPHP
jgi:23S rRNA (cytidine1920-2'-O)/16S rRNA (cytidine1409-2'-O)-methyltransferase